MKGNEKAEKGNRANLGVSLQEKEKQEKKESGRAMGSRKCIYF